MGLLMAWSDGYLDGTIAEAVLRILFPALVGGCGLLLAISFWVDKLGNGLSGKGMVITYLTLVTAICVFVVLPISDAVYAATVCAGVGFIALSLIVFLVSEYL